MSSEVTFHRLAVDTAVDTSDSIQQTTLIMEESPQDLEKRTQTAAASTISSLTTPQGQELNYLDSPDINQHLVNSLVQQFFALTVTKSKEKDINAVTGVNSALESSPTGFAVNPAKRKIWFP